MIYQLLALNVAVNSYDHALLTLLVSNQFVEIKGSVFKKFEKDNLFQITCAGTINPVYTQVYARSSYHYYRYRGTLHIISHASDSSAPKPHRVERLSIRSRRRVHIASKLWLVRRQECHLDDLLCE